MKASITLHAYLMSKDTRKSAMKNKNPALKQGGVFYFMRLGSDPAENARDRRPQI